MSLSPSHKFMHVCHFLRQLLVRNVLTTVVVTSAAITGGSHLLAQTSGNIEQLVLSRGTFFEIIADHAIPQAQQSWVLTQDQTFLEAGRQAVYRTRFAEVGTFALRLDLKSVTTEERATRTLTIEIAAKNVQADSQSPDSGNLAQTSPAIDEHGRTIPAASQSVIALIPLPGVSKLSLDMDILRDSNADGNPENDNDTQETYFSQRSTPLYLWLESPVREKTLTVRGTAADGTVSSQTIRIVDQRTASEEDEEERLAHGIASAEHSGGTVALSYTPTRGTENPLLFHWNFGDGQESLLDAPTHVYTKNGMYTVRVQVRNLTTGADVEEATTSVSVTTAEGLPSPLPPEGEEQPTETHKPWSARIILGIKILLVGLFSILLGAVAIFILAKLRGRAPSIQKTLAKAEEKLVGEKENNDTSGTLEILDAELAEEPVREPPKETRLSSKEEPPPPPPVPAQEPPKAELATSAEEQPEPGLDDDDDVTLPAWLKPEKNTPPKALETPPAAAKTPAPINTPEPSPSSTTIPPWLAAEKTTAPMATAPTEPSPMPQQKEPPASPAQQPPAEIATSVPPWLQPEPQAPSTAPEPASQPHPVTDVPAVSSPVIPAGAEEAIPQSKTEVKLQSSAPEGAGQAPVAPPAPVPPWLQSAAIPEQKSPPIVQGETEPSNDDEPVAFVSADSLTENQEHDEETPPPPPTDTSAPPPRTQPKI